MWLKHSFSKFDLTKSGYNRISARWEKIELQQEIIASHLQEKYKSIKKNNEKLCCLPISQHTKKFRGMIIISFHTLLAAPQLNTLFTQLLPCNCLYWIDLVTGFPSFNYKKEPCIFKDFSRTKPHIG